MQVRTLQPSLGCGQRPHLVRYPRGCVHVRATKEDGANSSTDEPAKPTVGQPVVDRTFPKRGWFSLADPNAEVYSKAGERFDPTKKGGRFKPEFIWQTNWQEQLKRQEDLERQQKQYRERMKAGGIQGGTGPGVVSFSRLGSLNDLDMDLSQQLADARLKKQQADATAAAAADAAAEQQQQPPPRPARSSRFMQQQKQQQQQRPSVASSPSYQFKDLPTRVEARRFKRAARSAAPGTVSSITAVGSMSAEEVAARAAAAAAEQVRYEQLKVEFQAWAIGLGTLGTATCYALYSDGVTISYALGAAAGLTYLRLLSRSVDSVGNMGAEGGMKSAMGQPRLLIPVVLALIYNRWNMLYADTYGFHLEFYAMLVGFFTYKLAVLGRQGLQLLSDLSEDPSRSSSAGELGAAGQGKAGGEDADSAMSLDRIFVRRVIRG